MKNEMHCKCRPLKNLNGLASKLTRPGKLDLIFTLTPILVALAPHLLLNHADINPNKDNDHMKSCGNQNCLLQTLLAVV